MRLLAPVFLSTAFLCAAPLFAQGGCTFVVTPTNITVPAGGSTGSVSVTQPAGSSCGSYTATVPQEVPWLHITAGSAGSVPGTVTYIADANPSSLPRSGSMQIALQNVVVTQDAANCSFGVAPKAQSLPVGGGSGSFAVTANCAWSVSPSAAWITFPGIRGGTSNGNVDFAVDANHCVAGRTGSITVATNLANPPVFSITQDGSPDNLTLSAASATLGSAASDNILKVTTGDGCVWSAGSEVSWIRIANGSPGTGNGQFVYHLLENTSVQRTGRIQVGPLFFTVTQQPAASAAVVLNSVANAANYATDAVAPGEIVTLFGANLGPAKIVTLQVSSGKVTDSLADTQVLFDDVAAPMVYTLAGQVSAVVPYGVAGKSTKVQVKYQGATSNTMTMPVQATTPAIFTLDASGAGPGAILNQDNTVNNSANPAARGSIVAIFLTGAGVTTPISADGSVTGVPPPRLAQEAATRVTIGGVDAAVKYAGAAPGSVAGLTQINVEVPAAVANGLALPVIVKVGDFASTGAATIAIR